MLKELLGGAAAAFDRAATMAAYAQTARARRRNRAESTSHGERLAMLAQLAARYESADADRYFREPRSFVPHAWQVVRPLADGGCVVDLTWPSDYQTHLPEMQERYHGRVENRFAAVRLFLHREPRPIALLVHGYLAGQYPLEERAWPIRWLHDRLGLDVGLFVLPFHAQRSVAGRFGAPPFPSSDPRMNNEGFRQAMADLRDLSVWLRERGHPAVGVMGMSLGGYTTALAATLTPDLAFAIPIIPLSSLADFARDQGRLGKTPEEERLQHAALEAANRVVSPLHRAPRVAGDRMLVVGAAADRITPIRHAEKIAAHFGAPLETWHGGHLLQFGRDASFRRIAQLLGELGLTR